MPAPSPPGGDAKFWEVVAPTLLGEHQGVFPPRLGDDGAVFHLTIPRARAGWAGGRAGAQAGLGWGAWVGTREGSGSGSRDSDSRSCSHPCSRSLPGPGREAACTEGGRPGQRLPRVPRPRSSGGSSGFLSLGPTWRIRSENKRRKWDTGRFPGSPLPSVLRINNPRLQRPPPRASLLDPQPLHSPSAPPAPGHRPRPRASPHASSRGYGTSGALLFCYRKSESPRGMGWRASRLAGET